MGCLITITKADWFISDFQKNISDSPTPVVEEHKSELKGYETTKATVRFPLNEKLPLALIEKLVQARVRKNDEADMQAKAKDP